MKHIYNKELLDNIVKNNNIIIKKYEGNLNSKCKITFNCSCGVENTKSYCMMVKGSGALCKRCSLKNTNEKIKKTCLEKYGVDNPNKNKEIREKSIITNLERYGVKNPFSSKDIINKIKEINIKKYGVDNPNKNKEIREKTIKTNIKKYGVKSPLQNVIINDKMKKTNFEKYGVENVSQNSEIHNKKIETSIKKYNVEYPLQDKTIKNKIKLTCNKKYGVNSPFQSEIIKDKIKKINILKYGVEYPMQSEEIKNKLKENNLKKYGVEYAFQSKEIQEKISKNSTKYKKYKFPSGNIRNVQGYEPFALDELIKKYKEEEIITDRKYIPRIQYEINNKKKYYFPDIYIEKDNLIIEVKSTWTYNKKKDINILKYEACIKNNYNFEFWIYNQKKVKEIVSSLPETNRGSGGFGSTGMN
jgi:hypothetical protein